MKCRLLATWLFIVTTVTTAHAGPAPDLSLARLYSLPWVVGTTPEAPAWSPDSTRVAFLWSDDGSNTRDLWWTDTGGRAPTRLTDVRRPAVPVPTEPDAARQDLAKREADPGITGFTWLEDGQALAYCRSGRLYRVPATGNPGASAIDPDATAVHEPVGLPHSPAVLYAHRQGLSRHEPASGSIPLVVVPEDVSIDTLTVSPDGRFVAFIETDLREIAERIIPDYLTAETSAPTIRRAFPGEPSERYRIGVVPTGGGPVVWMQAGGDAQDPIFSLAWSPDSRTLLVDRGDLYIKHRWIRLLEAQSGEGRTLWEERDDANVTAEWWSAFAPDGRSVYTVSDCGSDYQLWQIPLDGRVPKPVTAEGYAVFGASVVPAAGGVLFIGNREATEDRAPYWLDAQGKVTALSNLHGHHEPLLSPDGRWLADIRSDDQTPPELYLRPLHASSAAPAPAERRITHSPLPAYEGHAWATVRYVDFPNVHDGVSLHARLTLPVDFDPHRRYPAIIGSVYSNTVHNRWGGRVFHPTWALDQYLAAHGYVILNVDIRGSSGHGKAFRQRLREDYGGIDVDDLYSATRYLAGSGFVDEHRIGLWGSSYGGLLTTMSLLKHPGVYAAGVAGAPATNVFHAETGEMRTMMDPVSRRERYQAASPYLMSDALADPLLIIHGMRDDTVLFKDTLTLVQRLILADRPVELAVLPDAPHGWDTKGLAQSRYAFSRLVEFFERHLKPTASP